MFVLLGYYMLIMIIQISYSVYVQSRPKIVLDADPLVIYLYWPLDLNKNLNVLVLTCLG